MEMGGLLVKWYFSALWNSIIGRFSEFFPTQIKLAFSQLGLLPSVHSQMHPSLLMCQSNRLFMGLLLWVWHHTQWGEQKDRCAEEAASFGGYKHELWRGLPTLKSSLTSYLIFSHFRFFICKITLHRLMWELNRLVYLVAL